MRAKRRFLRESRIDSTWKKIQELAENVLQEYAIDCYNNASHVYGEYYGSQYVELLIQAENEKFEPIKRRGRAGLDDLDLTPYKKNGKYFLGIADENGDGEWYMLMIRVIPEYEKFMKIVFDEI